MKWRLLAAFTGLLAMVLLVQDVPLASYLRRVEKDRLLASLERDAFILAGASENALSGEADGPTPDDLADTVALYTKRGGARVIVTDSAGVLVIGSAATDKPGADYSNRPEVAQALSGAPATGQRRSQDTGGELLYVAVPVLSGTDVVGSVRITYPASVVDDKASDKAKGLVAVFLISLFAAVVAALLVASRITSPLRRLQRSTERVAHGDFDARASTDEGAPEIRGLASSFNAMTGQISELVERQRAFAGDASHQLRTPLTALRLQLERAEANLESDPASAQQSIEGARSETERLQRLVDGLLMLARADGATAPTERVDVSGVVRERVEIWQPLASERGVTLRLDVIDGLHARLLSNALEQIVDNIVDNSLNASHEGGTISVSAAAADGHVVVSVADDGPGLSDDQIIHAFDRLWRAPDAPHGGSGIGLAVVRQLTFSSGGAVELRNRDSGHGLVATVSFPADTS